ncbi:MAG: hypothetical protein JXP34_23720 [Planctomycetes bacterium]|nr:hypothetical protein [Planctomycetota bacterium]
MMAKVMGRRATGCALLALWAMPAAAQEARITEYIQPEASAAASSPGRDEYITLDVKDKDLREILQHISLKAGVNIVADPKITEKVTVTLDRIEWRQALQVLARQTHCTILEESDRLLRFTQPPSISMEFQDADLKVVLDLLAKQSGANIVVADDVKGKVTLSLREVPWREALDTIVKTAGYVLVEDHDTGKVTQILRVVRPEALSQQLESRFFQLKHIRPDEPYRAIITGVQQQAISPLLSEEGKPNPPAAGGKDGEGEEGFTLLLALRDIISEQGKIQYDPHTNSFYVKDTKPKLAEIERIIAEIDREKPQIFIDVKFIATSNTDILERGIKLDDPDTPEVEGLVVSAYGATPDPLSTVPRLFWGGTFPFDVGRWESLRSNFGALGILDFTQTQMILRLVKNDTNSRVIQEPKVTTLDNHPATIFVGETVPFAQQKIQADQNGNLQVTIEENDRSPINIGFTLYVRPHIIPGTDKMDVSVIPRVSSLSGTTSVIDGFERFSFSDPTSGTTTFIDLPRESSQTVVTYLRIQDGHTAVIGGLQTERRVHAVSKVPVLSSIPLIGNIFTWRRNSNTVESLLILITPHVLRDLNVAEEVNRRAIDEHRKYDAFREKADLEAKPIE